MSLNKFKTILVRSLLLVSLVCCWTSVVKLQTEEKPKGSTVSGVVVYSDTGHPLRHARIGLFSDGRQSETISDLRGRFEFASVQSGRYVLTVEAPGLVSPYRKISVPQTLVPPRRYPDESDALIEVEVNGRDSVELKIKAVRGGVITGKITGEDDQPVQGAEIMLLRRDDGKWVPVASTLGDAQNELQRADSRGVYRIAGLPAGDYLVRASEPSFATGAGRAADGAYRNGSFMFAYHPSVTRLKDAQVVSVVTGSESTGIDIRIPEQVPNTLTGTLAFALNRKPLVFVEIAVERSDELGFGTMIGNPGTQADSEGKWQVDGLPAGEYVVTIRGHALDRDANGSVSPVEALPKRIPIRIRDEDVNVLNATLTLGAQIVGRMKWIGKPPDEESIFAGVMRDGNVGGSTGANDRTISFFPTRLVNGEGKILIAGLEAGTYWLTVDLMKDSGVYVKSATRKGVDLMQAPIKLADELVFDDVIVTLATDLAVVEAQVTLSESRDEQQARSDVTVIIAPTNEAMERFGAGRRELETDENGKLVFRSAPGEYLIGALPTATYKKMFVQINRTYFEKNAERFLHIKLRAGEQVKDVRVPVIEK